MAAAKLSQVVVARVTDAEAALLDQMVASRRRENRGGARVTRSRVIRSIVAAHLAEVLAADAGGV